MRVLRLSLITVLASSTLLMGCQYTGKILNRQPETGSSDVMRKLFSIDTDKPFYITLPNNKNQVKLTEFISANDSQDSKPYVKGVLANNKNYSAFLDYSNITVLNSSDNENIFKFVAPYTLTNTSLTSDKKHSSLNLPSSALYLGAFELDYRTNSITQYDQRILGKYSALTAINYDGQQTINITMRRYPTEADQNKSIRGIANKLTFKVGEEMLLVDHVIFVE